MNSRENYSICQWDGNWRGSTGTRDHCTSKALETSLSAIFCNSSCSLKCTKFWVQPKHLHSLTVCDSLLSLLPQQREGNPLVRWCCSSCSDTCFCSDGMNRLTQLLPWGSGNGRRVPGYCGTIKTQPQGSSMHSHSGEAGAALLQQLLQLKLL